MIISIKDILLMTDNHIIKIIIVLFFATAAAMTFYGYKKYDFKILYKDKSVIFFGLLIFIEFGSGITGKFFPRFSMFTANDFYVKIIETVILTAAIVFSLNGEKYYGNPYPVTVYRMTAFITVTVMLLILIELVYVILILLCICAVIAVGVISGMDIKFKKNKKQ